MSSYIEYKDKVAFHPGYYIKEMVEESGLTQEDFAKRLDTTPKNLSLLVRGEQNLSVDIAMKLSRLSGTSIGYWLNLQKGYEELKAEFASDNELEEERKVFDYLDYKYFRDNYGLKNFPKNKEKQIIETRRFLEVSTISVLPKKDMAANFRSKFSDMSESNITKANAMVQIATNYALKISAPKYDKKRFERAIELALTQTTNHENFYDVIRSEFMEAGVIFVILPNMPGSNTSGATKKIGNNIMLMVNDRRGYADTFWFTMFHEIGHIINGDFGISFEKEEGELEEKADLYARNMLIPPKAYDEFVRERNFDVESIKKFAKVINRDPGIVLGRLQKDKKVDYKNVALNSLRHKYKVKIVKSEQ